MPDLQRERGMNAACRDRGRGGSGRAGGLLQTDALWAPSSPHGPLVLKAESPTHPSGAVAALPGLPSHACRGPGWPLPPQQPHGWWRVAALLQRQRRAGPPACPCPWHTDAWPRWGLSKSQNVMPLQSWQPWNRLKKINCPAPHIFNPAC